MGKYRQWLRPMQSRLRYARHPERQQRLHPAGAEAVERQALVHCRDRLARDPRVQHRAGVERRVHQRSGHGGRVSGVRPRLPPDPPPARRRKCGDRQRVEALDRARPVHLQRQSQRQDTQTIMQFRFCARRTDPGVATLSKVSWPPRQV